MGEIEIGRVEHKAFAYSVEHKSVESLESKLVKK